MENATVPVGSVIAKYLGERIPRYTSYPAAPHFTPAVGPATYRDWLRHLPPTARLSLYLHVPFCKTLCWYCGCHTTVTRHREPVEQYAGLMLREIAMVANETGSRRVAHVHFGGGTPAVLGPDLFRRVMSELRSRFDFEPDAEIAIEIDPRRLGSEMAATLGACGVTRASLGVQSFDPAVQKSANRIQNLAVTQSCAALLRSAGIKAINVDLLYGLPQETAEGCKATVDAVLTLSPSRLAVFGYAHVPQMMKHQRVLDEAAMPDADERLRQEQAIGEALVKAGYMRIGLDHYARPSDTMAQAWLDGTLRRNFQGYTDDPADALIGFGASSIGQLPQGYVQNAADLRGWRDRIEAGGLATVRGRLLTSGDGLRATIIERLMCDLRADVPAILDRCGFPAGWLDREMDALQALEADGLVRVDCGVLTVPEPMRNLVRRVASVFDAYLDPASGRHAVAV